MLEIKTIAIIAAVTLIVVAIVSFFIGLYFRSKTIKDLQQKIKKKEIQYDVLMDSIKTEIKERDQRAEKFEIKLRERDETIIKLAQHRAKCLNEITRLNNQVVERERIASESLAKLALAPKFQLVKNTKKRPAANDNYLYVEGELNGKREAGMLRLAMWKEAQVILDKNPEDRPE